MSYNFNLIISRSTRGNYRYIGSGSSRRVFDLGNGYVAKIAKNSAGIAQNKAEADISMSENSNIFAKVINFSDDFKVLIMEKADKIYSFSIVLGYFNVRDIDELMQLDTMKEIYYKYNLILADLKRKSSWGLINGRPVIIDYGFTKKVRKRYY